jgi:hypothetical protein
VRRPNRNVEIFSMSALDLFAAALGGFVLISIILFPNYNKQQRTELALRQAEDGLSQCKTLTTQLNQSLADKSRQLAETSQQLVDKSQQLAACEAERANTFIVILIEWTASGAYDIDLHVTDPEGHEFSFNKHNRTRRDYPSTEAQLSYDNTGGPGIELWQHPKAGPGTYKISYVYYSGPTNLAVEVKGNVFYRNGRVELPAVRLTEKRKPRPVARIVLNQRGDLDVQIEP